ncbi:MAG: hypothetical protein AAB534_00115 [Patescibacteria group bacterium]
MASRTILISKLFGLSLSITGIFLNPSVVGKLVATDGQIEQLRFQIIIISFEAIIFILGISIFLFPEFLAKKWRSCSLVVLGIAVAFVVIEFSARIFLDRPAFGWYGYPSGLYLPDATRGFRFTPNFKGHFLNPPYDTIPININSRGLRDVEHEYEKPKGVMRILGLGDSVMFGPGILSEETYLSKLEQLLKQHEMNVEIIKAGVNSYSFDQEYIYYLEEGYRYDPDIVIVNVIHKDILPVTQEKIADLYKETTKALTNQEEKKEKQGSIFKLRLECLSCNAIYMLFDSLFENWNKSSLGHVDNWTAEWENMVNWKKYTEKIINLHKRLESEGRHLVLVIFPFTEQFSAVNRGEVVFQTKLTDFGEKENILVLDLLPLLNVSSYYRYYLGGDSVHLNNQGHRLVAEALKTFLLENAVFLR